MGLFSKIKKVAKKTVGTIGKGVSTVAKPVVQASRFVAKPLSQIDPTYSKSLIGRAPVVGGAITQVSRMAVATSAAVVTGGASVIAAEKGLLPKSTLGAKTTLEGFATGAAVGAAIVGTPMLKTAASVGTQAAGKIAAETGIIPTQQASYAPPPGQNAIPSVNPEPQKSSGMSTAVPIALAAGAAVLLLSGKGD